MKRREGERGGRGARSDRDRVDASPAELAAAWLASTGSRLRQGLEATIRQRAWHELEAAISSEALVKQQRVQSGPTAA